MTKLSTVGVIVLFGMLALLSCKTVEQKKNDKTNWLLAHDYLSGECSRIYPCKDSAGQIVYDTVKVDNADFQKTLDSLVLLYQISLLKNQADSEQLAKLLSNPDFCKQIAYVYKLQIASLGEQIKKLKESYKPCPPSVTKTQKVYVVDQAKVQSLLSELKQKDVVIADRDKQVGLRDASLTKQRHSTDLWRIIAICAIGFILLSLIARFFIIRKPI